MTVDGHGSPQIKARFLSEPLMGWSSTMGGAVAAIIGLFQFLTLPPQSLSGGSRLARRIYCSACSQADSPAVFRDQLQRRSRR